MKQVRYLFSGDDQERANVAGILDTDTEGWWIGVAQTAIRSGIALAFAATSVAAEQSYQQDILPPAAAPSFIFQEEYSPPLPILQAKPFVFSVVDEEFAPQTITTPVEEYRYVGGQTVQPGLPRLFVIDDEIVSQPAASPAFAEDHWLGTPTRIARSVLPSVADEDYPQLAPPASAPAHEDYWFQIVSRQVRWIVRPFAFDDLPISGGVVATFTMSIEGGPTMTALITTERTLTAAISGGPTLTSLIDGGPS